jgi:hypothetical protein
MDYDDHRNAVRDIIDAEGEPEVDAHALSEACYAVSELGIGFDGNSVSPEMATQCWKIVEAVRKNGFPDELRM